MIVRLVAFDYKKHKGKKGILIYQVPDGSREMEVLMEALEEVGVDVKRPYRRKHEQAKTVSKPRSKLAGRAKKK